MSRNSRKVVVSLSLSAGTIRHLNRLVTGDDSTYRGRSRSNIVEQILYEHEMDHREKLEREVNAKT